MYTHSRMSSSQSCLHVYQVADGFTYCDLRSRDGPSSHGFNISQRLPYLDTSPVYEALLVRNGNLHVAFTGLPYHW